MKKLSSIIISILILNLAYACGGYKPIYTTDLQFEIVDYSIIKNKQIGRQIYSKLYAISKSSSKNKAGAKSINIKINTSKDKNATNKDSAGKVLNYKITVTSIITVEDYLTNSEILNQTFSYSSTYKVQDQYSETIKLENKTIENIINKIYQDLLIAMSEKILEK
tara:strand:+ start:441 stop:935 length:495 start_codon:yes stop_codon:yes gene_type:complete